MGQTGFYLQQDRCIGCMTCQVACKDKNDLDVGQLFRKVHEFSGGSYVQTEQGLKNNVFAYWVSLSCNHCEKPVCVENCPTGAMQKREADGVVFIDQTKCIGCRYCVMSCPYGAPQYNPKIGKTGKCDFCKDLLEKGKKPVCVSACPMRVLDSGPVDQLRKKYGSSNVIKGLPSPDRTKPALVITPHRDAVV